MSNRADSELSDPLRAAPEISVPEPSVPEIRVPVVGVDDLPVGVVSADVDGCWLSVTAETEALLGVTAAELLGTRWLEHVHPGDRREVADSWLPSVEHRSASVSFRFVNTAGVMHHVTLRSRISSRRGEQDGVAGVLSYSSAGNRSQAFIEALLTGSSDLVAIVDDGGKLRFVSPASTRTLGRDPAYWTGRDAFDLLHPDDIGLAAEALASTSAAGAGVREPMVLRLLHADGSWRAMEVVGNNMLDHPEVGGILLNCRDLTERHEAQLAAEETQRYFEKVFDQAPIGMALLSADGHFMRVNSTLCTMVDRSAAELSGASIFECLVPEDRSDAIVHATEVIAGEHVRPLDVRFARNSGAVRWARVSVTVTPGSEQVVAQIEDVTDEHLFSEMLDQEGVRIAREMDLAARVQQSLLPDLSQHWPGFTVAGDCVPAAAVGGDYYDVLENSDEAGLYLVVGDVAGHSLASSMMTTVTRSAVRRALEAGSSPSLALSGASSAAAADLEAADSFVTVQCVLLDRERGVASVASGGHNPLAVIRRGGTVEMHDVDGMPFGFPAAVPYDEKAIPLDPGDLVVLYTDGITEARSNEGHMYGEERFSELLSGLAGSDPGDALARIFSSLRQYTGTNEWADDVTALVASIASA